MFFIAFKILGLLLISGLIAGCAAKEPQISSDNTSINIEETLQDPVIEEEVSEELTEDKEIPTNADNMFQKGITYNVIKNINTHYKALNDEQNVKMAFDLGCTVYSGKPIDQEKFEQILTKFGMI